MQAFAADAAQGAAHATEAFYEDPTFWVAIAFVLFIAVAGKKLYQVAGTALDDRAETIRNQIEEATRLREEAQQLLAENQRRHRDAVKEAKQIVEKAKAESERMKVRAAADLERSLARRQQMAEDRIAQAEAKALGEVRAMATDVALRAAQTILAEQVTGDTADAMIAASIAELPEKLT